MKQKLNKRNKVVEHSLTTYSGCNCSSQCSCDCAAGPHLQSSEARREISWGQQAMHIQQMR